MDARQVQRLGALTILVVLLVPFAITLWSFNQHPELDGDEYQWLAPGRPAPEGSGLTLMWLGAAGVYISDGETSLLIDGFFTRPSWSQLLLGKLEPDPGRIREALTRAGIRDLDAVVVTHAHYDHALDAPWIAANYDARLLGSRSSANVARGQGLAEALIREVDGSGVRMGDFRLRFPPSRHLPLPPMLRQVLGTGETIDRPLTVPARLNAWREGQSRTVHLAHPDGNVLIQASAGFRPQTLNSLQSDVALVSVLGLGKQSPSYQADFVHHAVEATNPHWVLPIHWDDLTRPVSGTTPTMPLLLENTPVSLQALRQELRNPEARMRLVRPLWRLHLGGSNDGGELRYVPAS